MSEIVPRSQTEKEFVNCIDQLIELFERDLLIPSSSKISEQFLASGT